MKQRPGVMLYFDDCLCMEALPNEETGKLIKAILHYAKTGEELPLDGYLPYLWLVLRAGVDRDGKRYEQQQRQRNYAVYCREQDRQGLERLTYEQWQNGTYRPITEEDETIGSYPIPTPTRTPTAIPSPMTAATQNPIPAVRNIPSGEKRAAEEKRCFGDGHTVRLTTGEYLMLMDELGLTGLSLTMREAEGEARRKGLNPNTLDWVTYLRTYAKNHPELLSS